MKVAFSNLLISFCSILLVLPPGWCCHLPSIKCCHATPMQTQAADSDTPAPEECCCCPEKTSLEKSKPTPSEKPSAPRQSCCCEPHPVILPEKDITDVPVYFLAATLIVLDLDVLHFNGRFVQTVASLPPRDLQLLHSVWLC